MLRSKGWDTIDIFSICFFFPSLLLSFSFFLSLSPSPCSLSSLIVRTYILYTPSKHMAVPHARGACVRRVNSPPCDLVLHRSNQGPTRLPLNAPRSPSLAKPTQSNDEGTHHFTLTPHPSPLTPHPSPLTPHPSPLTPHPSPLTPHPSPLTPHPSPLTPHPSPSS